MFLAVLTVAAWTSPDKAAAAPGTAPPPLTAREVSPLDFTRNLFFVVTGLALAHGDPAAWRRRQFPVNGEALLRPRRGPRRSPPAATLQGLRVGGSPASPGAFASLAVRSDLKLEFDAGTSRAAELVGPNILSGEDWHGSRGDWEGPGVGAARLRLATHV